MQLLPGDKIFVATHTSISLYDTSTIEATANIPPASTWPHSRPTWLSEGELLIFPRNPGLSQLYHCCNTNEFRLIFSTTEAVYGITIPRQSGQVESEPELVELRDPHNLNIIWGDRTYFGYNTAVVIYSDACIKMLYIHGQKVFLSLLVALRIPLLARLTRPGGAQNILLSMNLPAEWW